MREICTSGSVGGEGGNILAYPAQNRMARLSAWVTACGAILPTRTLGARLSYCVTSVVGYSGPDWRRNRDILAGVLRARLSSGCAWWRSSSQCGVQAARADPLGL